MYSTRSIKLFKIQNSKFKYEPYYSKARKSLISRNLQDNCDPPKTQLKTDRSQPRTSFTMTMTTSSLAAATFPLLWFIATILLSPSLKTATPFANGFSSVHHFSVPRPFAKTTTLSTRHLLKITSIIPIPSALQYASRNEPHNSGGPMSQVDSTKSGGCPFLDTSYIYKTYAIPALFSESGTMTSTLIFVRVFSSNLFNSFPHHAHLYHPSLIS